MAGAIAKLVERLVRNEKVRGSTPLSSTKTIIYRFLFPEFRIVRFLSSIKRIMELFYVGYQIYFTLGSDAFYDGVTDEFRMFILKTRNHCNIPSH